jgi:hypothetical protein
LRNLQPWTVHGDKKLAFTIDTFRLGKQNYLPWPILDCLFLAERAFNFVSIQSKIDEIEFRHNLSPTGAIANEKPRENAASDVSPLAACTRLKPA